MVTLQRTQSNNKQTLGILTLPNGKKYHTLELAWKDNQRKISCIPKGKYKVVKRVSEKYGNHFHVTNVPNRDMILIHHANFHSDLLGCIAVGTGLKDINKDGQLDVINSRLVMNELNDYLPNEFELEIS